MPCNLSTEDALQPPMLEFRKIIFQDVFISGGVFLFTDASSCSPNKNRSGHPLANSNSNSNSIVIIILVVIVNIVINYSSNNTIVTNSNIPNIV